MGGFSFLLSRRTFHKIFWIKKYKVNCVFAPLWEMLGTGVAPGPAWLEHPHRWRPQEWDAEADATTVLLVAWRAVEEGHRRARWGELSGGVFVGARMGKAGRGRR